MSTISVEDRIDAGLPSDQRTYFDDLQFVVRGVDPMLSWESRREIAYWGSLWIVRWVRGIMCDLRRIPHCRGEMKWYHNQMRQMCSPLIPRSPSDTTTFADIVKAVTVYVQWALTHTIIRDGWVEVVDPPRFRKTGKVVGGDDRARDGLQSE
jgi:hypothetical protein